MANEQARRPKRKRIFLTADQLAMVEMAIATVRRIENDPTISEGRCLELALAEFHSAYPPHEKEDGY